MTKEEKVHDIIKQKPFYIYLGGKKVRLLPSSMYDDMTIGSIVSRIKEVTSSEFVTDEDMLSLLSAKDLAKVISITAKSTSRLWLVNIVDTFFRRKRAFRLAYKKASKYEIAKAVVHIIPQMNVFFYRNAIISLKGQNLLKLTKETETTAHTQ